MVPRLYEVLLERRAEFAYGPDEPVFATRLGTRNTPDNVRARIAPIHAQANELLAAANLAPIAQLTTSLSFLRSRHAGRRACAAAQRRAV